MTQGGIVILLLKIGLVSSFISIITWTAVYTKLSHRRNWATPIGRSLMRFALIIAALLVPFTVSLFFGLTRLDSRIVAWYDVVLIGAVPVEMVTRILVWVRIHRSRSSDDGEFTEDTPKAGR
jgi:hypothetical protein